MSSYTCFLLTCLCDCIISLLICSLTSLIPVFTDLTLLLHFILVYCHDGFLWPLNPGYWSWVMTQLASEMICTMVVLHSCSISCSIVSCSSVLCVPTVLLPTCCSLPSCCKYIFLFSRIGLSQLEGFRRQLLDVLQRSNKPKVRVKINRHLEASLSTDGKLLVSHSNTVDFCPPGLLRFTVTTI